MADTETNGAGPSARTNPEERTTLNFKAGEMAPLETRRQLRKERAEAERALSEDFNHAEFLKSVRTAEASGERGALRQLTSGGIAGDDADWADPAGGAPSGEGVTSTPAPATRSRKRANA